MAQLMVEVTEVLSFSSSNKPCPTPLATPRPLLPLQTEQGDDFGAHIHKSLHPCPYEFHSNLGPLISLRDRETLVLHLVTFLLRAAEVGVWGWGRDQAFRGRE